MVVVVPFLVTRGSSDGGITEGSIGMKRITFVIFTGAVAAALVSCNRWSLKSDDKAREALMVLQKLDARLEAGMSQNDYSTAIGDANFAVKRFVEGEHGNAVPAFSFALERAIRWYGGAAQVWRRKLNAPVAVGYCASEGLPSFQVKDLCEAYPDLITKVPGKIPSMRNSLKFAIALASFQYKSAGVSN